MITERQREGLRRLAGDSGHMQGALREAGMYAEAAMMAELAEAVRDLTPPRPLEDETPVPAPVKRRGRKPNVAPPAEAQAEIPGAAGEGGGSAP
jgi:hypothetical protein